MTIAHASNLRPAAILAAAALALGLSFGAASAQTAAAGDKVVATVDGMKITEKDLDLAADDLGANMPQMPEPAKRDYLVGYLADLKLGSRAAATAKVDASPDFAARAAYQRDKLLLDEYLSQEAKKAVTDEKMKALYADTVKDLKPEEEVHARHILVEQEADAKAAAERVKKGEDFAKVAAELSKDPGSGKEGGDLGWFSKERMVPEFADAAFKLQPGQVSEPVKSQFGWHVIKLEEKRTKPVPPYDEVKEQISQYLTRKAQTDVVLALRSKGKVERLDKPADAGAAAAAGATPAAEPKKP
ncbi:peptidylprolyl isomerase [Alsobacter metallidurans]|uniref:Parvulin-like PPIase n=1 Tax=Alsobacter metallidurans TaxID=340221 RepID=A0A917IA44_9HYPH|nr:peptidylprolyl isomerase [Alsobacter metallidurans]GGH31199.1 peptidylprolyl isomerase [Alsobacter metallidurans]